MTISRGSTLGDVAAAVADALDTAGIPAVLTGGACATIHSRGAYQSHDLDFIIRTGTTRRSLDDAMASVGFRREGDRYVHPATAFFVEFPRGALAIGEDVNVKPVALSVGAGRVLALSATDSCRDRLAAFYHWSDRQSLEVAVQIALVNRVNMRTIERWSEAEDAREQFAEFRQHVEHRKQSGRPR